MLEYLLIVGQGRSGTNWLLDIMDCSAQTHCRSEPNEVPGSPLAKLPCPDIYLPCQADLESCWDEAISWTAARVGERDHPVRAQKRHIRRLCSRVGIPRLLMRRKLRRLLSLPLPSLRRPEWLMPRWLCHSDKLERAMPVLKLVQVPGWAAWVLKKRPLARVIHIVRHPGGFLNSWWHRYLADKHYERVQAANRRRLEKVIQADSSWAPIFGDLRNMSAEEAELLYWRYAAETIHQAGIGSPRYELVAYEKLVTDTVGIAKRLYDSCGLPWRRSIESAIQTRLSGSMVIANAWKTKLNGEHLDLVGRVLAGSTMQNWWEPVTDEVRQGRPREAPVA